MNSMNPPPNNLGLYVNFPVSEAIRRAPADPEQAAEVLRLAARIFKNREPVPFELADYLADAFSEAMKQEQEQRASALAHELHVLAGHKRRHKADAMDVYRLLQENPDLKRPRLVELIKKKLRCSEKVARNLLDQTIKAIEQNTLALNGELVSDSLPVQGERNSADQ